MASYAQPQPQQQHQYGAAAPQPQFQAAGYPSANPGYPPANPGYPNPASQYHPAVAATALPTKVALPTTAVVAREPYRYNENAPGVDMGDYKNQWSTGLCTACCTSPLMCLAGCLCSCCMVWHQRKEILQSDWSQYRCCQGFCTTCCADCCHSMTPAGWEPCCLCCESVWCLTCAQHANRLIIRQHYELEGSCCEMCIVHTLSCLSCLACLCDCDELSCLLDCMMHCTLGCMIGQQAHHMNEHGYPLQQHCDVHTAGVDL